MKLREKKLESQARTIGMWLGKPYLHYVVGSEVNKDMVADLKKIGITKIEVTPDEPAFRPTMLRLDAVSMADPDWIRRLGGERLRQTIGNAVAFGQKSTIHGTSYIPGLALGQEFGETKEKGKY